MEKIWYCSEIKKLSFVAKRLIKEMSEHAYVSLAE